MLPEVMILSSARKIREDVMIITPANHHYVEKRYKKAKRYLDELIRRNPYSKNPYVMRAVARYRTRDLEGACADFTRITSLLHQPLPEEAGEWCL